MTEEETETIEGEKKKKKSLPKSIIQAIVGGVASWLKRNVKKELKKEFSDEYESVYRKYIKAVSRAKFIAFLLTTALISFTLVMFIWIVVGLVYIAQNTTITNNMLYVSIGIILGYLICLITGYIFMRG